MRMIQFRRAGELTRRGALWPPVFRGCDEFHNKTICVLIPMVGAFTIWEHDSNFDGPEHLHAAVGSETFGVIEDGCDICTEILTDFTEHLESQFRGK